MVDSQAGLLSRSCTISNSSNPLPQRHVFVGLGVRDAPIFSTTTTRCQALFLDIDAEFVQMDEATEEDN